MVFRVGPEGVEYKKSPVRGCVLTGLEEVGMKERRETSFLLLYYHSNYRAIFKSIS